MARFTQSSGENFEERTLLHYWLEKRDTSYYDFAKRIGHDPKTVNDLANGRRLPSYILAYKIQDVTEGGVPAESWLGTEIGRIRWNEVSFDWERWQKAKRAATARHDAVRTTPKKKPKARKH